MTGPPGRVAILGGGMAGLSAAWRLSEPGWQDRFESITVYQRGWRLGGKGASSRGSTAASRSTACTSGWVPTRTPSPCCASATPNSTGPQPIPMHRIQTWDQALSPPNNLGVADRWDDDWLIWLATFTRNDGAARRAGSHRPGDDRVDFVDGTLRLCSTDRRLLRLALVHVVDSSRRPGARAVGIDGHPARRSAAACRPR